MLPPLVSPRLSWHACLPIAQQGKRSYLGLQEGLRVWATDGPQMGHKAKRRPFGRRIFSSKLLFLLDILWLRGQDLNLRPLGYEPNELPGCSTPRLSR
jgi:hypothetical protein